VRNAVDCYDCRVSAGTQTALPSRDGWHTYLYVFEGAVSVGGQPVGYTESALITGADDVTVEALEDATVVAFDIDPDAPVTRQGTIGR
jgi:Pirin-related protein